MHQGRREAAVDAGVDVRPHRRVDDDRPVVGRGGRVAQHDEHRPERDPLADGDLDWAQVETLAERSYRLVALKRMIKALEGTAPRRTRSV